MFFEKPQNKADTVLYITACSKVGEDEVIF